MSLNGHGLKPKLEEIQICDRKAIQSLHRSVPAVSISFPYPLIPCLFRPVPCPYTVPLPSPALPYTITYRVPKTSCTVIIQSIYHSIPSLCRPIPSIHHPIPSLYCPETVPISSLHRSNNVLYRPYTVLYRVIPSYTVSYRPYTASIPSLHRPIRSLYPPMSFLCRLIPSL